MLLGISLLVGITLFGSSNLNAADTLSDPSPAQQRRLRLCRRRRIKQFIMIFSGMIRLEREFIRAAAVFANSMARTIGTAEHPDFAIKPAILHRSDPLDI